MSGVSCDYKERGPSREYGLMLARAYAVPGKEPHGPRHCLRIVGTPTYGRLKKTNKKSVQSLLKFIINQGAEGRNINFLAN